LVSNIWYCIYLLQLGFHYMILYLFTTIGFPLYDIVFIYYNWVSTQWQWSGDLSKNRKETAIYKRRNSTNTILNHKIHTIENKHTKQENKHKKKKKKK
jgi:hypothetical protein